METSVRDQCESVWVSKWLICVNVRTNARASVWKCTVLFREMSSIFLIPSESFSRRTRSVENEKQNKNSEDETADRTDHRWRERKTVAGSGQNHFAGNQLPSSVCFLPCFVCVCVCFFYVSYVHRCCTVDVVWTSSWMLLLETTSPWTRLYIGPHHPSLFPLLSSAVLCVHHPFCPYLLLQSTKKQATHIKRQTNRITKDRRWKSLQTKKKTQYSGEIMLSVVALFCTVGPPFRRRRPADVEERPRTPPAASVVLGPKSIAFPRTFHFSQVFRTSISLHLVKPSLRCIHYCSYLFY